MKTEMYIVIPVHNRKSTTQRCLDSLAHQTFSDFQVIVVDDGSTDGTSDMIRTEFPETIILHGDGNLWWSGGTNKGIRHALEKDAELVVTLNDDVMIRDDYIEKLVGAHRGHPRTLIGSINLTQEKPPQLLYAGIESFNRWSAKCVKRGELRKEYNDEFSGLLPTYSLPGRGVLIPREVFDLIGLFDEKHFKQYAADQDFSLRAKAAGFELYVCAECPVFSPYEPERVGGEKQTLQEFVHSFFTMRSCNYLPVLARYYYRHSPCRVYAPILLVLEVGRRVGSFIKRKS